LEAFGVRCGVHGQRPWDVTKWASAVDIISNSDLSKVKLAGRELVTILVSKGGKAAVEPASIKSLKL